MTNTLVAPKKKQSRWFKKEFIPLHLMALPTVLQLIIFSYIPMVGVLMAFQNFNVIQGFFRSQFVGFRNFEFLFASSDAWVITRNTVLYHFGHMIIGYPFVISAALIVTSMRTKRTAKYLQTIYMMPTFLSWAAVSIVVAGMITVPNDYYNTGGIITWILSRFGVVPVNNSWQLTRAFWPPYLLAMNLWKGAGTSMILYIAVISGIPTEQYEAAVIEGANKLQQAWYITIPHLRFIITISLIMSMGGIIRGDFGLFFTMTGGAQGYLLPVIDIVDTYVYRGLMNMGNLGMAAAAGLYQAVVGMVMILFSNWIVTKIDPGSALI
jgi:putative aldouronate transport system permease protein